MVEAELMIAGVSVRLDPAGALWLPQDATLVVADLHLEKASSFARHGTFLPPYDTRMTLRLLSDVIQRRDPRRVIALGDSFHDSAGFERLEDADRLQLARLQRGRDWIWVAGNHDRDLPFAIGGAVAAELEWKGLVFRHEPQTGPAEGEVAGHLHPAGKVSGGGRSIRCRAFATDGLRMVLPAFGILAGGLNLLDRAFAPLFAAEPLRPFLMGGGRLFPVPFSSLRPD
jgi:DNA ligase-associated metallophosphoesterase